MQLPSREEFFGMIVVAGLLILTASANALLLLAWATISLLIGLGFWWRRGHPARLLAVMTGAAVAMGIALWALLPRTVH